MNNVVIGSKGLRRAALAVAAVLLPLWLVGCSLFDDDDDDDSSSATVVPRSIDDCRLQFPVTIDETENAVVSVLGRVFSAGVTDMSGVNDPDPAIVGAVGVGPRGSDPATAAGWAWSNGAPNPGYMPGNPGHEPTYDEYQASLTLPGPAGDYDYAFRFTGDAGTTFTYCDSNGSVYDPAAAGQLTSRSGLILWEYIEGDAVDNNDAVEIYNASAGVIDLDTCAIEIYANGSAGPPSTVALNGSLTADTAIGVCNSLAGVAIQSRCSIDDALLSFTGDDAVALVCDGANVDVIGQIGIDPGAEWSNGGVGTQDETLRRKCTVTVGDGNGADAFDPSLQWDSFGADAFLDLGIDHCP